MLTCFKALPFVSSYYYSIVLTPSTDFQVPLSTQKYCHAGFSEPPPRGYRGAMFSVIQPFPHLLIIVSNATVCHHRKFQWSNIKLNTHSPSPTPPSFMHWYYSCNFCMLSSDLLWKDQNLKDQPSLTSRVWYITAGSTPSSLVTIAFHALLYRSSRLGLSHPSTVQCFQMLKAEYAGQPEILGIEAVKTDPAEIIHFLQHAKFVLLTPQIVLDWLVRGGEQHTHYQPCQS